MTTIPESNFKSSVLFKCLQELMLSIQCEEKPIYFISTWSVKTTAVLHRKKNPLKQVSQKIPNTGIYELKTP